MFETLAAQDKPPKTLISASGIGFYGVSNETKFTEESSKGRGFLADVVEDWESAPEPLHKVGTRVVNMRMGVVLSPDGGALAKMSPVGFGNESARVSV